MPMSEFLGLTGYDTLEELSEPAASARCSPIPIRPSKATTERPRSCG